VCRCIILNLLRESMVRDMGVEAYCEIDCIIVLLHRSIASYLYRYGYFFHITGLTTLLLKESAGRLSVTATISRYDQAYVKTWIAPTVRDFMLSLI